MDQITISFAVGFIASCAAGFSMKFFINFLTKFQDGRIEIYKKVHLMPFKNIQDLNIMFAFIGRLRYKVLLNYIFLIFITSFFFILLYVIDSFSNIILQKNNIVPYILIPLYMVIVTIKIAQIIKLNTAERACKEIMRDKDIQVFETSLVLK